MAKHLSEKEVIQRALWIESLCRKEMRRLQYNRSEYEKTVYSWVRSLYAKHKEGKLTNDFLKLIEQHSTFLYYFVIGKDPTELFDKYRNNTLEQIKTIAMQRGGEIYIINVYQKNV